MANGLPARFLSKFTVNDNGCWIWNACRDTKGYGRVSVDGVARLAHRVIYELLVGPIPEGLTLDHTCHNDATCEGGYDCPHRPCVNPDHLEPVTSRLNTLRGQGRAAKAARRTHCDKGHEYTPDNTYARPEGNGKRRCRSCERLRSARRYAAWRAEAGD